MTDDLRIGEPLDWTAATRPAHTELRGSHILLRPVDAERDAAPLYAVSHLPDGDPANSRPSSPHRDRR